MCCISMAYIKRGIKEIIMNKTIIFDLDGTLTDSEEGILKSVTYALESFGYEIPPRETLLLFLGPPLVDSFQEHCGMSLEEAEKSSINNVPVDLIQIDLMDAFTKLGEIIGITYSEEVINNLFKNFCVGK